jgi:ferrous iron transport protein B
MSRGEAGFTPLHALSLMLFMVLYPPLPGDLHRGQECRPAPSKWMLFSMTYPMVLGLADRNTGVFPRQLPGPYRLQAMFAFYDLALETALLLGFVGKRDEYA